MEVVDQLRQPLKTAKRRFVLHKRQSNIFLLHVKTGQGGKNLTTIPQGGLYKIASLQKVCRK